MPKMPKKQRKNKKREDKRKLLRVQQNQGETKEEKLDKEKWGHFYIVIFIGVAVVGAGLILFNV